MKKLKYVKFVIGIPEKVCQEIEAEHLRSTIEFGSPKSHSPKMNTVLENVIQGGLEQEGLKQGSVMNEIYEHDNFWIKVKKFDAKRWHKA